jgi:hypothetical protein
VIIHGLQGHPVKAWLAKEISEKRYVNNEKGYLKEYFTTGYYWRKDFLAKDFTKARAMVYRYDSKVPKFFGAAADKNSVVGHARELLNDLVAIQRDFVSTIPVRFLTLS